MKYTVFVNVLPREEILDPQGKATLNGLHNLEFSQIDAVRIGKRIRLDIDAETLDAAREVAHEAAQKLLTNPVVESFTLEIATPAS